MVIRLSNFSICLLFWFVSFLLRFFLFGRVRVCTVFACSGLNETYGRLISIGAISTTFVLLFPFFFLFPLLHSRYLTVCSVFTFDLPSCEKSQPHSTKHNVRHRQHFGKHFGFDNNMTFDEMFLLFNDNFNGMTVRLWVQHVNWPHIYILCGRSFFFLLQHQQWWELK